MFEVERPTPLPPRIVEYSDYHAYLRDYYLFKKAQNRNFSFRKFAQLAGIKSSNFLMLVMNGQRRLSLEMAQAVAKAMKLSRPESDYFKALVRGERVADPNELLLADRERKIAVKKIITKDLPLDKTEYLSVWYYSLVRELAFLPDFKPTAAWISAKLPGLVSEQQAEKAIRVLVNLGLWKLSESGVQVADVYLDSGLEEKTYGELKLSSLHSQVLVAWSKILDELPKSQRELGFINIPINGEKIPELKRRIQQFQDEVIGWLQDEKAPTQIVQLGTYMVPVTKV